MNLVVFMLAASAATAAKPAKFPDNCQFVLNYRRLVCAGTPKANLEFGLLEFIVG